MEFAVQRSLLADELTKLQSVIQKKTAIPVLNSIKIDSEGQGIKLTATNMETSIFSHLNSNLLAVTQEGSMCVPAKLLSDIVRLCPDGPIKVTSDVNDWVRVLAKKSNYRLAGVSPTNFPELPKYDDVTWVELPASHVKNMILATKFSITQEGSRMNLRGAKLEIEGSNVRMITTDGSRISLASATLESLMLENYEVLIPVEGIEEISKLMSDQVKTVGIAVGTNNMFFRVGHRVLSTRLMVGQFPGYQLPFAALGTYEHFGTYKADLLSQSIQQAMICAQSDDKKKEEIAGIQMQFEPSVLRMSTASANLGEAQVEIESNFNGPELTIFCNGKYLRDYLDPVGVGEVRLEIKDGLSQMYMISEKDGVSSYYILMPMRSK